MRCRDCSRRLLENRRYPLKAGQDAPLGARLRKNDPGPLQSCNLNREHACIDGEHDPKEAPIGFIPALRVQKLADNRMHSLTFSQILESARLLGQPNRPRQGWG